MVNLLDIVNIYYQVINMLPELRHQTWLPLVTSCIEPLLADQKHRQTTFVLNLQQGTHLLNYCLVIKKISLCHCPQMSWYRR